MSSTTSIREHLATALHADRDHTRDGVDLGSEPTCNCYTLADVTLAALSSFGRVQGATGNLSSTGKTVYRNAYQRRHYRRIVIELPWEEHVSGSTGGQPSSTSNDTNASTQGDHRG